MNQKQLRELLWYDAQTGVFRWRKEMRRGIIKPWSVAGGVDNYGYIKIKIKQIDYRAHRLVWMYVYGQMPTNEIDHINGIRNDNRLCNLRPVTVKQNKENVALRKDSSTGCLGVHFCKKTKKYVAKISHNKKPIYVGRFDNIDDAATAVRQKRREIYSHYEGRDIKAKEV